MSEILKLPSNIEAERLVLGGVILDNGVAPQVLHDLNADDFISESHRYIFSAMRELDRRNRIIDPLTLIEELQIAGVVETVGGHAFVAKLIDGAPRLSNVTEYVRIIRDCSLKRRSMRLANWILSEAPSDDLRVEDFLTALNAHVEELQNQSQVDDLVSTSDAVERTMRELESRWESGTDVIGLSTGFADLDRYLLGMRGGKYYVLAAGTGVGKTTLALNIADRIVHDDANGRRVGLIISLEMSVEELTVKLLATHTKIDTYQIETGKMSEPDRQIVREAARRLKENISIEYVEGFSKITASSLIARANKVKRKHGRIDFLLVDYLQLLDSDGKIDSENIKLTEISRTLKRIAQQMNIPVIVISQLNRKHADRRDRDYQLSDLRGSGSIEQDADVVMFLMPEDWNDDENINRRLVIEKHRGGKKHVTINLVFFADQSRFELAAGEDFDPVYSKPNGSRSAKRDDLEDYYSYM